MNTKNLDSISSFVMNSDENVSLQDSTLVHINYKSQAEGWMEIAARMSSMIGIYDMKA